MEGDLHEMIASFIRNHSKIVVSVEVWFHIEKKLHEKKNFSLI